MAQERINIEGMSCGHCVSRVQLALEGLDGVSDVSVDLSGALVSYDEGKLGMRDIVIAVEDAGYKVYQTH